MKNIFFISSLLLYVFIVFGGQSYFTSTGGSDASTIATLESEEVNLGDSYAVMSLIYNSLPEVLINYVVILVGILFIFSVYKNSIYRKDLLLLFFLLTIPIILTISTFQKDLILVLFVLPVYYIIQSGKSFLNKVFIICAIYLFYAVVFRNYYFLITFFFIFILFFKKSNLYIRFLSLMAILIVIFILPDNIYYKLQSARDIVNEYRIGVNMDGNRTAFNNPLPPNSLINFIINYVYAIIRLNFGFFFTFGIKDIFFVIYPLIYYYYTFKELYRNNSNNFLAAALILSHAIVYFLFEPDTGSYARHLASTLPYLAIIINSRINKI
ncbi:hypothetical protein [Acinetobacter soli]|uniref:hypothetical protein n=1 Tax=Acinetobacter soli TaxID=487316 RepID=UPI0011B02AB1|nr:hypothetical protein [Acinetobacter soli]